MGYKIDYGTFGRRKSKLIQKKRWFPVIWGVLSFVLFLAFMNWENGKRMMQEFFLPGDGEVTAMAVEGMITDLKEGVSFSDALTVFCREILSGGT